MRRNARDLAKVARQRYEKEKATMAEKVYSGEGDSRTCVRLAVVAVVYRGKSCTKNKPQTSQRQAMHTSRVEQSTRTEPT